MGDVAVAVAGELHEFLGHRTADGGHGGGEVAEVVEPEVGASDQVAGLVEAVAGVLLLAAPVEAGCVAVHLPRREGASVGSGEHEGVRCRTSSRRERTLRFALAKCLGALSRLGVSVRLVVEFAVPIRLPASLAPAAGRRADSRPSAQVIRHDLVPLCGASRW